MVGGLLLLRDSFGVAFQSWWVVLLFGLSWNLMGPLLLIFLGLVLFVRPDAGAAQASPAHRAVDALVGRRARLTGTVYLCLDPSASMADRGKMQQLQKSITRLMPNGRTAMARSTAPAASPVR